MRLKLGYDFSKINQEEYNIGKVFKLNFLANNKLENWDWFYMKGETSQIISTDCAIRATL